jgi:uncharacterized membrane-anchored protein YitT (DUF2179 family)
VTKQLMKNIGISKSFVNIKQIIIMILFFLYNPNLCKTFEALTLLGKLMKILIKKSCGPS